MNADPVPSAVVDDANEGLRRRKPGQGKLRQDVGIVVRVVVVRDAVEALKCIDGDVLRALDKVLATPDPLEQHEPSARH